MRYIRYAFLAALAVVLVTVALANRGTVTLHLLPEELGGFLGWSWTLTLPLFIVIFGGIIAGILIGFVWEWFREHRQRVEAATFRREKDRLSHEVRKLKSSDPATGDDVLALLEEAR